MHQEMNAGILTSTEISNSVSQHVSHTSFHSLSHKFCLFGCNDETTWTAWTVRACSPRHGAKGFFNHLNFPSTVLKLLNQIISSSRQVGDHSPDETSMLQHCSSIPQSCLTFAHGLVACRCLFHQVNVP